MCVVYEATPFIVNDIQYAYCMEKRKAQSDVCLKDISCSGTLRLCPKFTPKMGRCPTVVFVFSIFYHQNENAMGSLGVFRKILQFYWNELLLLEDSK